MTHVAYGVTAGTVFGAISVASMLPLQFPDKRAALTAAFLDRFAIGFVIAVVNLSWPAWAVGLLIGVLLSAPSAVITRAWAPILGLGAIGGLLIAVIAPHSGSSADPVAFTRAFAFRFPLSGDTLVEGRTYTLRWLSAPGRRINLGAVMGGHDKGELLVNAPSDVDSLVWTVPLGFVTGFGVPSSNQMRLRLEYADSANQWVETGPFIVTGVPKP